MTEIAHTSEKNDTSLYERAEAGSTASYLDQSFRCLDPLNNTSAHREHTGNTQTHDRHRKQSPHRNSPQRKK